MTDPVTPAPKTLVTPDAGSATPPELTAVPPIPPVPPVPQTAPVQQDAPGKKDPKDWSKDKKQSHHDKRADSLADLLYGVKALGDALYEDILDVDDIKDYDPAAADRLRDILRDARTQLREQRDALPVKKSKAKAKDSKSKAKAGKSSKQEQDTDEPSGIKKFLRMFSTDRD